jgi:hypothetical protein
MGFGGALIAWNQHQRRQPIPPRQGYQNPRHEVGILRRVYQYFAGAPEPAPMPEELERRLTFGLFDEDAFDLPPTYFPRQPPPAVDYKPEYTHPTPAEGGFTFNFAPPEPIEVKGKAKQLPAVIDLVNGATSPNIGSTSKAAAPPSPVAKISNLLVCARCLDPLVLGSGLVGDEARDRKVWALRCGHMIDGKCLDQIGIPADERKTSVVTGNRSDRKGKGKAHDEYEQEIGVDEDFSMAEEESAPIRSRLRARRGQLPEPSAPSSVLGKRKRGGRSKPKVERTYEWHCPIDGCGHLHASVKIDDVWQQEGPSGPTITRRGKKIIAKPEAPGGRLGRGALACFV